MDKIKTILEWHDINTDEIRDGGFPVLALIEQDVWPEQQEDVGYAYTYAFRVISRDIDSYLVEGQGGKCEEFSTILTDDNVFCRQRIICWAEFPNLNHHLDRAEMFQNYAKTIGLV